MILEEVTELSASPFGSIGYTPYSYHITVCMQAMTFLFMCCRACILGDRISELSTFDSFKLGLNQASRGLSI